MDVLAGIIVGLFCAYWLVRALLVFDHEGQEDLGRLTDGWVRAWRKKDAGIQ